MRRIGTSIIAVVAVALIGAGLFWWAYGEIAVSKGMGTALNCTRNPDPSVFNAAPYYTGPLFETHLHIPSVLPPPKIIRDKLGVSQEYASLGDEVTIEKIICLMDKENITRAVAFFPMLDPPFIRTPFIKIARRSVESHGERIIPFILPTPFINPTFDPNTLEKILGKGKGVFKGYGEIPFYWDEYRDLAPDSPQFLESFKILGERGLMAMIHPDNGQIRALETAFRENPDVTFILHGMSEDERNSLSRLLGTYPNAYYSLDSPGLDPLFNAESKEEFMREMEENFHVVLEKAVATWKDIVETNSEKIMWGTDRFTPWSFDEEVGTVLEEYYRAFIGRLDPAVQELYAYKNAEALFEK
jgi:hypothetical protein